jgi:cytochrome c2
MDHEVRQSAKGRWAWRGLCALTGLALAVGTFAAGAYFGKWWVKNQGRERLGELLHTALSRPQPDPDTHGDWQTKSTILARLETTEVYLPTADGWGGGIQAFPDGRIFFATVKGDFGVLGVDGITRTLGFHVDMNLDALTKHPVTRLKNYNLSSWVRVTDVNLTPIDASRYELLVGHHYFDAEGSCMVLRLSRSVIAETPGGLTLAEPFRTVLTTKPCITFNLAAFENAFEGHFSGGRIARLDRDHVLFSTGDHGWAGVLGHPAVSQQDDSTLGKVLFVNVRTNEVEIFAKGVRNPQGLTVDSKGRIWETEQGPRGGDELNLITRGQNYGWPENTYGTDYGPLPWPLNHEQGRHDTGVPPLFAWSPSIAASNVIEATGPEFPLWRGDLLVASLRGQAIHRLRLEGTRIVYDEPIEFSGSRLRDIVQLPSGRIALLTDRPSILLVRNADSPGAPFLDTSRQQRRTSDMSEEERALTVAGRFATPNAVAAADMALGIMPVAMRGEQVFQSNCAACHSLASTRSVAGPTLNGVIGRRVGSADFPYSDALLHKRDVWTGRRLVEFAVRPASEYAGTSMPPVRLTPADQRDLEEYLEATPLAIQRGGGQS